MKISRESLVFKTDSSRDFFVVLIFTKRLITSQDECLEDHKWEEVNSEFKNPQLYIIC